MLLNPNHPFLAVYHVLCAYCVHICCYFWFAPTTVFSRITFGGDVKPCSINQSYFN